MKQLDSESLISVTSRFLSAPFSLDTHTVCNPTHSVGGHPIPTPSPHLLRCPFVPMCRLKRRGERGEKGRKEEREGYDRYGQQDKASLSVDNGSAMKSFGEISTLDIFWSNSGIQLVFKILHFLSFLVSSPLNFTVSTHFADPAANTASVDTSPSISVSGQNRVSETGAWIVTTHRKVF